MVWVNILILSIFLFNQAFMQMKTMSFKRTRSVRESTWQSVVSRTSLQDTSLLCAQTCAQENWNYGSLVCNAWRYEKDSKTCQTGFLTYLEDTDDAGHAVLVDEDILDTLPLVCDGGDNCCTGERPCDEGQGDCNRDLDCKGVDDGVSMIIHNIL